MGSIIGEDGEILILNKASYGLEEVPFLKRVIKRKVQKAFHFFYM